MWGFGILGAGAVAALAAATIPPATPDPAALPSTAPGYALVKAAAHAQDGIVEEVRGYVDESDAAFTARMSATAACMADKGFPEFAKTELSHRETGLDSFIYGFAPMDVATARKTGYPYPKGREVRLAEGFEQALFGTDGEQKSFTVGTKGFVVGGCKLQGIEAVYGTGQDYAVATDAYSLVFAAVETARHAPAFDAVLADWQVCMAKASYEGSKTPGQASRVAAQQGGQMALKIAVADATCREQVQLEKRLEDVAAPYLTTVVAEHRTELDEVARLRAEAETRAAALKR